MFLFTIVCKMDFAAHVISCVDARRSTHVRCVVVVYFKLRGHQNPNPDVELSTAVKKWLFYGFLNNPSCVYRFRYQKIFNLLKIV